jgi:hypothetical protein
MEKHTLPVYYSKLHWAERRKVREQYIEEQEGLCMYCKKRLSEDPPSEITDHNINWKLFPPNFLKYPVHLQHDHYTDKTEGAVHAYCNAVLWQYENR